MKAAEILSAARRLLFLLHRDNCPDDYFASATRQQGIAAPGCEAHSAIIFGLPAILLQVMAEFAPLFDPATVTIRLAKARGVSEVLWLAARRFGSFATTAICLITLPWARGERRASLALTLAVIAAKAAAPRTVSRIRVFIFFLSGSTELHCAVVLLQLTYPSQRKIPQKIFRGNLRDFSPAG